MDDPFESPRLLISHAREEIEDAECRIKAFFDRRPYAHVIDLDHQSGQQVHKVRLTAQVPGKISAIIKDVASNLRDALDHAVYASAVRLVGNNPKQTGFPFAKDAIGVEGELRGKRLAGNPPELRPFLLSFRPYEGGNDLLWGLNSIRNPNTHRMIVPVGAASIGNTLRLDYAVVNGPTSIGYNRWDPTRNEVEFMRLGPGSNVQYQVQVSFDVHFDGVHALRGKLAIASLRDIAAEVERVITGIEAETARILGERAA